jgi:signal transduction histidine kinase
LNALYYPSVLRSSPLLELLGAGHQRNLESALRHTLTDAIEFLRPGANTPAGSRTWCVYQILRRRYTEQVTQRAVAADLGLSIRQMQREEKLARKVLADHLWAAHNLGKGQDEEAGVAPLSSQAQEQTPPEGRPAPSRVQELEGFQDAVPPQVIDTREVIREVLETIEPLRRLSAVAVSLKEPDELPLVWRQALLNLVSTAIRLVPGGEVVVEAGMAPDQVTIRVCAVGRPDASPQGKPRGLRIMGQLVQLCRDIMSREQSCE